MHNGGSRENSEGKKEGRKRKKEGEQERDLGNNCFRWQEEPTHARPKRAEEEGPPSASIRRKTDSRACRNRIRRGREGARRASAILIDRRRRGAKRSAERERERYTWREKERGREGGERPNKKAKKGVRVRRRRRRPDE